MIQDQTNNDSTLIISSKDHNYEDVEYVSRKINYQELISDVCNEIMSIIPEGSMISVDGSQYSLKDHTHKYDKIKIDLPYELSSNVVTIAKVKLDDMVHDLNSPILTAINPLEPVGGQIKFVAKPYIDDIDVDSETFDGWVYANGQEYDNKKFKHWNCFQQNSDLTKFIVPNIKDLIYMYPNSGGYPDNDVFQSKNSTPSHNHTFNLTMASSNGSISDGTVTLPVGNSDIADNGSHPCNPVEPIGTEGVITYELNAKLKNIKLYNFDGNVGTCRSNGIETLPTCDIVNVMVYIGRKVQI